MKVDDGIGLAAAVMVVVGLALGSCGCDNPTRNDGPAAPEQVSATTNVTNVTVITIDAGGDVNFAVNDGRNNLRYVTAEEAGELIDAGAPEEE